MKKKRKTVKKRNPIARVVKQLGKRVIPNKKRYNRKKKDAVT